MRTASTLLSTSGGVSTGTVTVAARWGPAVAAMLLALCALLTAVTALVGAMLTGTGALHPFAILAGVTIPAMAVARTLAGRRGKAEVRSLVHLTALIWVRGSLVLLLLRGT